MRKPVKRIGEILVEKGFITEAQLHDVLMEQGAKKTFLGELLIGRGWVSKRHFLEALSEQFDIPMVTLKEQAVDMELSQKFSSSLILDHKCFPLSKNEDTVTVAITNPLNAVAISKIEEESEPCRVNLVLVDDDDLKELLAKYRQYVSQNIQRLLRNKKRD
jgi:type IV pilus assembly protein PilB